MSSLQTRLRCACITKKSIIYGNNRSCKHRLAIVLRLHIEYNSSLAFSFFTVTLSPVQHQPSRYSELLESVLLSLTLLATLGENCLLSVQRDLNFENKRRKLRQDGFYDGRRGRGVGGCAATVPEISEWTLLMANIA